MQLPASNAVDQEPNFRRHSSCHGSFSMFLSIISPFPSPSSLPRGMPGNGGRSGVGAIHSGLKRAPRRFRPLLLGDLFRPARSGQLCRQVQALVSRRRRFSCRRRAQHVFLGFPFRRHSCLERHHGRAPASCRVVCTLCGEVWGDMRRFLCACGGSDPALTPVRTGTLVIPKRVKEAKTRCACSMRDSWF